MTHTIFSSLLALVMMFPAASGKTTEYGKLTLIAAEVSYSHSPVETVYSKDKKGGNKGDDDPIVPPNYR